MSDDRLLAALRGGGGPLAPDPAFAERLFDELCIDLRFRGRPRARNSERRVRTVLLVAALVVVLTMGLVAAMLVAGLLRSWPVPGPRANGWIVFAAQGRAGANLELSSFEPSWYPADIYIVREGVGPRRIIGSGEDDLAQACPAFSPDGEWLIYTESRWQWDSAGGRTAAELRQLEAWRLMLTSIDDAGDPVGPGRTLLEGSSSRHRFAPCAAWAPDGRRLAATSGWGPLELVTLDGKHSTLDGGVVWNPVWSPDGDSLAVMDEQGVLLLPVGRGSPRRLAAAPDAGVIETIAWAPDASSIVATGVREATAEHARGGFLASIPVDGGEARTIVQLSGPEVAALAFAPDGSRLAYLRLGTADPRGGTDDVVVSTLDGGSDTVFQAPSPLDGSLGIGGLMWAPNGDSLLYVGYRFPGEALVTHPLDPDLPARLLTPITSGLIDIDFDWQAVGATSASPGDP